MKEPIIPIVVDSREQLPYRFDPAKYSTTVACLPSGDYSLVGFERQVAVERKSLQDYLGSITSGRDRFIRELVRLRVYGQGNAFVVVEGSIPDVTEMRYRSEVTPASVLGTTCALCTRQVPVLFAGNRANAHRMTEGLLRRWWLDRSAKETK